MNHRRPEGEDGFGPSRTRKISGSNAPWRGNAAVLLREAAMLPIRIYRYCLSPFLPPACRYVPTCSEYALDAIRIHGVLHGILLTTARIARCHPWSAGGYDPVPERARDAFKRLTGVPKL